MYHLISTFCRHLQHTLLTLFVVGVIHWVHAAGSMYQKMVNTIFALLCSLQFSRKVYQRLWWRKEQIELFCVVRLYVLTDATAVT